MSEQLKQLKQRYEAVPIPDELEFIVKKAVQQRKKRRMVMNYIAAFTAAALIFIVGINTSPAIATALSEVPLVGSAIKVLTFKHVQVDGGMAQAEIKVPAITNLDNKALESALNNKYMEESRKLYENFMDDMEQLKQNGGGHLGVESGYVVKTDNEQILAVGRYVVNTVGSSSTTFQYDTIDKKDQLLITLPSLFKDERYINLISENIKEQMKQQMEADPNKMYWLEGNLGFKTIRKDQSFYINSEGKLVISFDKYEVAPGYMGVLEFIIPTDVIADALVSKEYVK